MIRIPITSKVIRLLKIIYSVCNCNNLIQFMVNKTLKTQKLRVKLTSKVNLQINPMPLLQQRLKNYFKTLNKVALKSQISSQLVNLAV